MKAENETMDRECTQGSDRGSGYGHTIDDVCERERPKGTTSDQSKPPTEKGIHVRVLKEIKLAMISKLSPKEERLTSSLPFLELQDRAC